MLHESWVHALQIVLSRRRTSRFADENYLR
jgi:hypothetical protein